MARVDQNIISMQRNENETLAAAREKFLSFTEDSDVLGYFGVIDFDGEIYDARKTTWYMDKDQVLCSGSDDDNHLLVAQVVTGKIDNYLTDSRTQNFCCWDIDHSGIREVAEIDGLYVGALVQVEDGRCILLGPGRITFPGHPESKA